MGEALITRKGKKPFHYESTSSSASVTLDITKSYKVVAFCGGTNGMAYYYGTISAGGGLYSDGSATCKDSSYKSYCTPSYTKNTGVFKTGPGNGTVSGKPYTFVYEIG